MEAFILKTKVTFIGITGWDYTKITLKAPKGFTIDELDWKEARDFIQEKGLTNVFQNEYGKIYGKPNLKRILNSRKRTTNQIINILKRLDNED